MEELTVYTGNFWQDNRDNWKIGGQITNVGLYIQATVKPANSGHSSETEKVAAIDLTGGRYSQGL